MSIPKITNTNAITPAEILGVLDRLTMTSVELAKTRSPALLPHDLIPVFELVALERIARALETIGAYHGANALMGLFDGLSGGKLVEAIKRGAKPDVERDRKGNR